MRLISYLNLLGVVLLAGLCAVQWTANRRLNLKAIQLDKSRVQQAAKITDQDTSIKGYMADLNDFRDRLERSEFAAKKAEQQVAALFADRDRSAAELARANTERDEMHNALAQWMTALKERDDALRKLGDGVGKLAKDRDEAVEKYNDLAVKYSRLVKDLDEARAKLVGH